MVVPFAEIPTQNRAGEIATGLKAYEKHPVGEDKPNLKKHKVFTYIQTIHFISCCIKHAKNKRPLAANHHAIKSSCKACAKHPFFGLRTPKG